MWEQIAFSNTERGCYSLIMGGMFAILAALSFTFDNILIRKGLTEEHPGSIWDMRFVISLASICVFIGGVFIAALFGFNIKEELEHLSFSAVFILIISGALGPLLGAVLYSIAIAQIGASHTAALFGGSNPIFATLLAVVFLAEVPDLIGLFSVVIIVGGIVVVGYHGHEGTVMLLEKTKIAGGIIALLAGVTAAVSQIGRGAALNLGATPITALFIFHATALVIVTVICLINKGNLSYLKHISRKSLYCYSGSGTALLAGNYFFFISLTLIPAWQAVAIRNIQPILVLFMSWIFLKTVDRINWRLIFGAALVTLGVIILNVY